MKFTLTFSQDQIKPARAAALAHIAEHVELKGFRKGKAPLDLVEQSVSQDKIIEETVSHLIPEAYGKYIKEQGLKPIVQPKISISKMVTDGDWEFNVEIAEKPEVKLGKYMDEIASIKAKDAIWVPGKEEAKPGDEKAEKEKQSKRLEEVLNVLLKTCEVEISELLIEEEVNKSLSRLLNQVDKLGLTIDQYVASLGKTVEGLRAEYHKAAEENLKLEFILEAVARDQKIEVTDAEMEAVFATAKPEEVAKVKADVYQMAMIRYSLIKQKTLDYLLTK